jgi:aspartate aminotransferase
METLLSERVRNLEESQTIAMAQKSRELKAKGIDIISLSLGEPDFDTPDFIKKAAQTAIDENFSKYTPIPGYLDVREAISKKFKRDNDLNYTADQIVISTGAKQSIANVVLSLINPGDEVIVPSPYWVSYIEIIRLAGGVPVIIDTTIETDYKVSASDIERHITSKTKMLIYSSPCNPSGSVFTKNELRAIAEVIAKHPKIFIVSDEIYELINFEGKHESIAQFDFIYNQVITVNGVSKAFAMTGWRIGYIGAPKWIADACNKIQSQFTSGASSIAQKAAKRAVEADPKELDFMKNAFHQRRDLVLSLLSKIPGIKTNKPQGAFYIFIDISGLIGKTHENTTIKNATDLSMFLLEDAHVAMVTGEAFGDEKCIRFSYAASEKELIEAVKRISHSIAKLK